MEASKQHVVVDDLNLAGVFYFHRILRAVTMGLQPPRLLIGLFMVATLMTGGMLWDWATGPQFTSRGLEEAGVEGTAMGAFEAAVGWVVASFNAIVRGVAHLEVATIFAAAENLFIELPVRLWIAAPWFTIFYGLFFVVVIAIGGGALARMTACEFAGRIRISSGDAVQFAAGNWWRLVLAPLLPLLVAGVIALILMALGWFFMLPGLKLLGGPLYGLALLAAFVVAFLLIGYAFGFSLLLPAVASENCDPADALQRAYAYVMARPLHLLGYGVVALVGLTLGCLLVSMVAAATLNIAGHCVGAFADPEVMAGTTGFGLLDLAPHGGKGVQAVVPADMTWAQGWAAGWIGFWQKLVVGLVVAYVIAYYFAASTIVYLLMRRAADGQDISEIWQPGTIPGTYASVSPQDASGLAPAPTGAAS